MLRFSGGVGLGVIVRVGVGGCIMVTACGLDKSQGTALLVVNLEVGVW